MRKSWPASALLALCAAGGARAAEPRGVSCALDKTEVPLDGEVELTCTMTGPSTPWTEPSLGSLTVLARWKALAGEAPDAPRQVLRMLLAPTRTGPARIGSVELLAGGVVVAGSEPLVVTVVDAELREPVTAKEARDLSGRTTEPSFIHVAPRHDATYAGEPLELTWELWQREALPPARVQVVKEPRFDGVGVYQLDLPEAGERRERLGQTVYRVTPVARRLVATSEPRALVIPELVAWVTGSDAFDPRRQVLRSLPVLVEVKPLPALGRPEAFNPSNVGQFTLETRLLEVADGDPVSTATGATLHLEARISGHGNPVDVGIDLPEGGRHFAVQVLPGSICDVDPKAVPIRYARKVGVRLLPLEPGTYRSPTIHLSYFDTELRAYRVLTQQGRMLRVTGAPVARGDSAREVSPLLGGLTLGPRRGHAARFELGWPHFEVTYVLAFSDMIDASPQLKLRFGRAMQADVVGIEPGFEIRWTLWRDGDVSLAYVMDPAVRFWLPLHERSGWMGFTVGGPGIAAAYRVSQDLNLFWGFRVPIAVNFGDPPDVIIPLYVDGGLEVGLARGEGWSANFHGTLTTGLELCAGRCPIAQFAGELTFGAGLVWD